MFRPCLRHVQSLGRLYPALGLWFLSGCTLALWTSPGSTSEQATSEDSLTISYNGTTSAQTTQASPGSMSEATSTSSGLSEGGTDTGTSAGETSSAATTSPLSPQCGDGRLSPEVGEECDDGNTDDDDPCSAACAIQRTAFLSSAKFLPSALSGSMADQRCQDLAEEGKAKGTLPNNSSVYRAWLSTPDLAASARNTPGKHRYVGVQEGEVIAADWNSLIQGDLSAPIAFDELGAGPISAYVWTGTKVGGGAAAETCQGWTVFTGDESGVIGGSDVKDGGWTDLADPKNPAPCELPLRIYCLEQGNP